VASVTKTIEIVFMGSDKLSGTIGDVSGKIADFSSSISDATKPLLDLSTAILKVDAVVGALAIGGMAVAINQAGKFGDSFAEISTLTDASAASLDKFKTDILDYSRTSTASIDDINKSIYSAISAGTDYTNALSVLNTAEQLSVAGKADLESTTRVLVSSLNAYSASTEEAGAYSDALFKTVKLGQTTLPELAESIAQVTTTAANSGVSFDELMASIAAVTATGTPTTQAVTAIKAAIAAIVKPTAEATKEATNLGIQFDASALATKGLDGVLKDVYKATGGATEQIVKLFGSVESLPAVMTLGADTSGRFAKTLEEFSKKTGATTEAYEKMAANFGLVNQNLANNVNATFVQVGDKLILTYAEITTGLADVAKAIGLSIDAGTFDGVFAALNTVGADLSGFLEELANTLPEAFERVDWSGFILSFEGLSESISNIFKDFDPSDPQDVADAIQFVVDSLGSLADVTAGMVDVMGPVINKLIEWADAFNSLDSNTKVVIGQIIEIGAVVSIAAGIIAAAALAVKGLAFAFSGMGIATAATSIATMGPAIAAVIGTAAGKAGLLGLAAAAGYAAGTFLNENVPAITTVSQKLLGWADELLNFTGTQKSASQAAEENTAFLNAQRLAIERNTGAIKDFGAGLDAIGNDISIVVKTNFDEIQNDWNALTSEIENSDIRMPDMSTNFDSVQNDWDAITDEIEASDIRMPVKVKIDDTELKKKLKDYGGGTGGFEPINIPVTYDLADFNRDMQSAAVNFDSSIPDFDLEGLSGLFDDFKDATSSLERALAGRAIEAQIGLMEAAGEKTEAAAIAMRVAAELQWRAANVMMQTSEGEKVIKIDAQGVEPELEIILWKILKKIQVRANESGAEFLLAAA